MVASVPSLSEKWVAWRQQCSGDAALSWSLRSASAPHSSSLGSTQTAFTVFLNEGADPAYSILLTDFSVSFWTVVPRRVSWERFNNWLRGTQFFCGSTGRRCRADNYKIFLLKAMYRNLVSVKVNFDAVEQLGAIWNGGWGRLEERKHQPMLVFVTACLVL